MELKEEQAKKYLEEAELSLDAAKSVFDAAKSNSKKMWAQVVKGCYDAMEQAISAALAKKGLVIPKDHPTKVSEFLNTYKINEDFTKVLLFWLRKRSSSQYVDIKHGKVIVPHEVFSENDAEKAINDCGRIIAFIKELIN